MVQVVFEGVYLLDSIGAFFSVNATRPRHVLVCGSVFTAQVIVNEYAESFVIVAQKRVGARLASDSQRFPRSIERQRQNGNGLKRRGMFGQCSVM